MLVGSCVGGKGNNTKGIQMSIHTYKYPYPANRGTEVGSLFKAIQLMPQHSTAFRTEFIVLTSLAATVSQLSLFRNHPVFSSGFLTH